MFECITPTAPPPTIQVPGPLLLFGGCYSNIQAMHALMQAAAAHGIAPAAMICTGDIVAYGANPQDCVDIVRASGMHCIMGNCEEQLAADAADCGCGFAPGSACDILAGAWFSFARTRVDAGSKAWMAQLPRRIDLLIGGKRLAIVHGAPSRINRFIFASAGDELFAAEMARAGCDGVIAGHCGMGFTRMIGDAIWHNAGAIGMPANDGTQRGWYSIISPHAAGFEITTHALPYDHEQAAQAMRAAGLPEDYASALETGIWPNLDILPMAERAMTATAQHPSHACAQHAPAPPIQAVDAMVALDALETLWFNTGTLCNLACSGCYIESSPRNDRLAYFPRDEFERILNEARATQPALREIGFTGGEPFMNPDIMFMIGESLAHGYRTLILTNAMRPMARHFDALKKWRDSHPAHLALRVSLDHFTCAGHQAIRGAKTWQPALAGLNALFTAGFTPSIAARFDPAIEDETTTRAGFAALFNAEGFDIDAFDPAHLVLFPEMDKPHPVAGVSAAAWQALRPRGVDAMCRTSRMVVQHKGAEQASIVACTLLPYETRFTLGSTLAEAARPVTLDHPSCAQFCVFGASSCMSAR